MRVEALSNLVIYVSDHVLHLGLRYHKNTVYCPAMSFDLPIQSVTLDSYIMLCSMQASTCSTFPCPLGQSFSLSHTLNGNIFGIFPHTEPIIHLLSPSLSSYSNFLYIPQQSSHLEIEHSTLLYLRAS